MPAMPVLTPEFRPKYPCKTGCHGTLTLEEKTSLYLLFRRNKQLKVHSSSLSVNKLENDRGTHLASTSGLQTY